MPEYRNGQIPRSALAPIPGGMLRRDAAAAFAAMSAASEREFGVQLRPEGPLGSYRDLAGQEQLYAAYRAGRGNLAAVPGTSNHGWGLAVDFPESMWSIVHRIGAHYGWSKAWSDAPSEPWHFVYKPGVWHGHAEPAMPPDQVALAQQLLRAAGARHLVVDGRLDAPTIAAVREMQQRHGLTADGLPGPKTIAALRALVAREERDEAAKEHARRAHSAEHAWARPAGSPAVAHAPEAASGAAGAPISPPAVPPVVPLVPLVPATPTRFPLNRVVAFLGPYLALASGVLAAWLGQHFPGLDIDTTSTAQAITQAAEFAIGAGITWALHHKYLDGWQKWEAAALQVAAAAATLAPAAPPALDGPPDAGVAGNGDAGALALTVGEDR